MECKLIKHGIALSYDRVVKPCCAWKLDSNWCENNHISNTNIVTWHNSKDILDRRNKLSADQWPTECVNCQQIESQGRFDSIRGNGNSSYRDYTGDDIFLEFRPGNTCNMACQTCWPEASSRVANYHLQAGLIDKIPSSIKLESFDFLMPVASRIRDVVLLGGEPFYDKGCKNFLAWAQQNLKANLTLFTNGSVVDFDFIRNYPKKITLVFSLDAVGTPADYIRFGAAWDQIYSNYLNAFQYSNVEVRVNVTTTVYNYYYVGELIELLCQRWPSVVSFGRPHQLFYRETAVPMEFRNEIIERLESAINTIMTTDIEEGQQANAANAIRSIVNNLRNLPFDAAKHAELANSVQKLDQVKGIKVEDYCPEFAAMLKK